MKAIRALEVERRRRDETQTQLAAAVTSPKLSVNQMTISLLERGTDIANGNKILKRIARHFDLPEGVAPRLLDPVHVVFSDDPNDPPPPPNMALAIAASREREAEAKAAKAKRKGGKR